MKKVFQRDVSLETGECMRASIASILELDIDEVPHFRQIERLGGKWLPELFGFLKKHGYEFRGTGTPNRHTMSECSGVDGYLCVAGPSGNLKGAGHMVVYSNDGKLVHDPNPNGGGILSVEYWWMIHRAGDPERVLRKN